MNPRERLALFDAFGVELEYMLVDRARLDVRPFADAVLADAAIALERRGDPVPQRAAGRDAGDAPPTQSREADAPPSDVADGPVTWSNELALHVLEMKVTQPAPDLRTVLSMFQRALDSIQPVLAAREVMLMPTAMHPWMDPAVETRLWPHTYHEIYQAFDRVFGCRSHGWSNLQSVHLNLPFDGDEQFARLHAAVRVVLPLLPALAASSPIADGRISGLADTRLHHYRHHCDRVRSIVGDVIPERVYDEASYRRTIFDRLYADIAPLDPSGELIGEFLNARGAIARFDRGSIEVRLIDVQECPAADVAICAAVVSLLRALVAGRWLPVESLRQIPTAALGAVLEKTMRQGEQAVIDEPALLEPLGAAGRHWTADSLWRHLIAQLRPHDAVLDDLARPLDVIFEHGTLARRILRAAGKNPTRDDLADVYGQLAACLRGGESFVP